MAIGGLLIFVSILIIIVSIKIIKEQTSFVPVVRQKRKYVKSGKYKKNKKKK